MTRRIAVLLALAVCLAQAGVYPREWGQEAAGVADKISKDWKRFRTAHFEAVSNAPVEKVNDILVQLEAFHRYLVTDILELKTASPVPTVVFILKDDKAFSKFKPRRADGSKQDMAAYFAQSPDMNHIVMPIKLQGINARRLIFHEYFHFVIHRNFPGIPTWMSEGMAEFFSTYEVDPTSGQCNIGRPIENHILWLREEKLLPLEQMLSRDGALKLLQGKDRQVALFYAQSWALVHYLMISDNTKRQPQLKEYLAAIKNGLSGEKAFQAAFRTTVDDMQQDLKAYAANSNFYMMRYSWDPEDLLAESTVEALTEIEADYLQADLLERMGADADAEEVLRKILVRSPSYVPAKVSLAAVLMGKGRLSEAIETLRPIADGDSAGFRAHLILAQAYALGQLHEDSVREYRRAAAANEGSSTPWLGISIATLILGRQDESDAAMERLQALEANPEWYSTRAYEAFEAGLYAVAVGDAGKYIEKAGPGAESSPYMAFLGALCLLRLGQAAESEKLLEEVRPEIPEDSWQMRVMDFLQGRISADRLLSLAKDGYERTEAHAYAGLKDSIAGRRGQAIDHLRWVKENGSRNYVEYGMAVAELQRLEAEGASSSSGK